jgi:DNA mismatch repair protein MutS
VTRAHVDKAPASWRRKQTIATGERFTCDDLDALADKLAHAEERAATREAELVSRLVRELAAEQERLRVVAARLASWDVASALAEVAHRDDWVRPEIDDSLELVLEDARHPVVEKLAAAGRYVPNDVSLGAAAGRPRLWLVTGPNMAGKSTLMRQTALCVILAQMGAFVPARRATLGVVDRVLTRVGASDNLSRGESTFMVEMKETANVLRSATKRSLVVLDEIGRGTSTYDGLAIAWAVAEHLHDTIACRALFATHYHELTELADQLPGVVNLHVSVKEAGDQVIFLRKVEPGRADRSYGIEVARLAGLPVSVVERAREILALHERSEVAVTEELAPRPSGGTQIQLFEPVNYHIAERIRNLKVDELRPIDALQLLSELQRELKRQ